MDDSNVRGRRLFFAIFTISGFSGLIYESIWSHYLKLFLGHAAYAQTLVLAIFMGGMAVGSWLTGKYSSRIRTLLLGYAIVEGVIGVLGLLFHGVSVSVTSWAFDTLLPNIDSAAVAQTAKWTLGALLILPQSVLLGSTFPLMSGAVMRRFPQRSGETLAMLYFTNSLGAAIGVLASGFVLIDAVGLPGTMMTAGLLNVALALTVWGIFRYERSPEPVAVQATAATVALTPVPSSLVRWMLIGAAVTGAAAFLYEIAWIRMLSMVLGSSTHSFELMLSAFILGIALGGLWVRKRIDSLRDPLRFLGRILMIMAAVALLSLPVYNLSFDLMAGVVRMFAPTEAGYRGYHLASHAIAMLVMIPTTFFCGMTLPIMTNVLVRSGTGERAIGAIYAWNTAGAIAGVILAVHVMMPLVGVKGIVIAGATLHFALAVFFSSKAGSADRPPRRPYVPAVAVLGALAIAMLFLNLDAAKLSSGVFRHGLASQAENSEVIFLEHGKTASVSLVDINGLVSIATNGKPDAAIMMKGDKSSQDEITMILAGALPIALHAHPAKVANIGIGSGLTSQVLLASDTVKTVDTVEIEPLMARAAERGFMPRVERTFKDPRSHIHFEDAKTFFALQREKYDVIVSEPSNPWVSGVSTLFSEEFYRQITRYLEPDGMLIQWIQTYEADMSIVYSVVKALAPQFDDFAIYNADDTNLLIVATRRGPVPSPDARIFASDAMRAELLRVGIVNISDIESRFMGNKKLLLPLLRVSGVPANSDYFPFVDLNAPRARILKREAREYPGLQTLPVPFFELIGGKVQVRERTYASPTPISARDRLVAEAVLLRDAISTSTYDQLSSQNTRMLLALDSSKEACSKPAVRRAWLDSAFLIAADTTAALSAAELERVWDHIGRTACASMLNEQDKDLFDLMDAVAKRDAATTATIGTRLLTAGTSLARPSQLTWLLIATTASQVATGQLAEARELLRKVVPSIKSQNPSDLLAIQWISAIAYDKGAAR